jgi:hypothetical protein
LTTTSGIESRISNRLVDLIDIVFGVVVATSLAAAFGNKLLDSVPSLQQIATLANASLIVGYTAIILSWVGYHKMIEYDPYKMSSWGNARFAVDVIIVFVYTFMIYSVNSFTLFLSAFPLAFFLYAFGGILRNKEYGKVVSWPLGSSIFFIGFLVNFAIWLSWDSIVLNCSIAREIPITWILLSVTLFYLILYRWKRGKMWLTRKA